MARMARMRAAVVGLVVIVGLAVAGCGGEDASSTTTDDHNEADVAFATDMIPHHAQALHMVEMAEGRGASGGFEQLLEDIEAAQEPEIDQMSQWLGDWGEEVPPTDSAMPMGGGGGHDMEDMDGVDAMPGMMSGDDLDRLDTTQGEAFERMWLRMMIEHHEGAIEMARTEVRDGESEDVIGLAEGIIESQTAEIDLMEDMLRG